MPIQRQKPHEVINEEESSDQGLDELTTQVKQDNEHDL